MNICLVQELTTLGFSDRVAGAYVFTVSRPEVSAGDVAEKLSLTRQTAHDLMVSLVDRGLARMRREGNRRVFCAEHPMMIRKMFEEQRKMIESRVERFETLLPNFSALCLGNGAQPMIRCRDGIDGLLAFQREFDALQGETIQLFDHDTFSALDTRNSLEKVVVIPGEKRVRSVLLTNRIVDASRQRSSPDLRMIPHALVSAQGEMSVCEDRVLLLSYVNGISAIEIRSQVIADVCRATLELAWEMAGRVEEWTGGKTEGVKS